ncbi:hypothetical protein HK101_002145, partial [Irineochytrium annulatum]
MFTSFLSLAALISASGVMAQLQAGSSYNGYITYYGKDPGDAPPVQPYGTGACGMTWPPTGKGPSNKDAGDLPDPTYWAALSQDLYTAIKGKYWYSGACGQCVLITYEGNQQGVVVPIV